MPAFRWLFPTLETPKKKKKKKKKKIRNTAKCTTPPPPPIFRWALGRSRGTGGQCFYFSKWNNPEWAFRASRNFRNLIPGFDQFFYDIQDILLPPFYISQESKEREREKKTNPLFKHIKKSENGYNESSSFSNDLMKRKSFRASRGREGGGKGKTEFRWGLKVENGTTNRLLSLMISWNVKASALRAGGGGGDWIRRGLRVENGTTNRLLSLMISWNVKASSLRAGGGGGTEFRRGLRVENGTTNRLLSLMISWNVKASALRAGGGGGELNSDEDYFRERYNESSSFSNIVCCLFVCVCACVCVCGGVCVCVCVCCVFVRARSRALA